MYLAERLVRDVVMAMKDVRDKCGENAKRIARNTLRQRNKYGCPRPLSTYTCSVYDLAYSLLDRYDIHLTKNSEDTTHVPTLSFEREDVC